MEIYRIDTEVAIIIEKAEDFGKGIADAFVRLAEKLENKGEPRDCYGLVIKLESGMTYYAGFTELYEGEAREKELPSKVIESGHYLSLLVDDWNQNILHIGPTFDRLLQSGRVDISSPCIEFYRTEKELVCMVKSLSYQL